MEQEDYIKRQIDQLGRVLGKILADLVGLISQGQEDAGIESADQTLKTALELDSDQLADIPASDFLATLQLNKELNSQNLDILAGILFAIAEEAIPPENDKKKKLLERSLTIYQHLDKTSSTYSFDRHLRIEKIKNSL